VEEMDFQQWPELHIRFAGDTFEIALLPIWGWCTRKCSQDLLPLEEIKRISLEQNEFIGSGVF
jgi:hypothetical protein